MGRNSRLTNSEKNFLVQGLADGESTLKMSKKLSRDHRTIKNFIKNGSKPQKRPDKGKFRSITSRQMRLLKRELSKQPLSTSKMIFDEAQINCVSRNTRCRVLNKIGNVKKAKSQPLLSKQHKQRRVEWAKKYMKVDFSQVVFSDECRATLDGPDGFARGWIRHGTLPPVRAFRQQKGGGIMFWAAIHGENLVGPFRIDNGIKINSETYTNLLKTKFIPYINSMKGRDKKKVIFMQDNAPSHASTYTKEFLRENGLSGTRLMDWPSASPDLNPIENYWAIFKNRLYAQGKQFKNKDDLWTAITATFASMPRTLIKTLTSSMDNRIVQVLQRCGGNIGH